MSGFFLNVDLESEGEKMRVLLLMSVEKDVMLVLLLTVLFFLSKSDAWQSYCFSVFSVPANEVAMLVSQGSLFDQEVVRRSFGSKCTVARHQVLLSSCV